ncbi:MAG: hypothetical protein FWC93_05365 [Defluviitaleaceae bacterium]|nr:hypothetical protein [Defluviitaleaceae bacterium]
MKSIKLMLSGGFLALTSIFIMVLMIVFWVDAGISANSTGIHAALIFAPFIGGVALFIIGLITKTPND